MSWFTDLLSIPMKIAEAMTKNTSNIVFMRRLAAQNDVVSCSTNDNLESTIEKDIVDNIEKIDNKKED